MIQNKCYIDYFFPSEINMLMEPFHTGLQTHLTQHTWTKLSAVMRIWIITTSSSRKRARPCAASTSSKVKGESQWWLQFFSPQLRLVVILNVINIYTDDDEEDEEDEDGEAGAEEGEGAQIVPGGNAVTAASVQPSAPQQINSSPGATKSAAST